MLPRRRERIRLARLAPAVSMGRPVSPAGRPFFQILRPKVTLTLIEDRRRFHPLGKAAPAAVISRRDQRRIVEKVKDVSRYAGPLAMPVARLGFAVPSKVAVCVRRKQRREAIFAFGRAGKGAAAKRRRRSEFTNISC